MDAEWPLLAGRHNTRGRSNHLIRALRDGHVGLVVLINKYDGIDLPSDACRILALDGCPRHTEHWTASTLSL